MKPKTTGYGSISTVFSSIVLVCVSSIIIMIIIIIIIIKTVNNNDNKNLEEVFNGYALGNGFGSISPLKLLICIYYGTFILLIRM